MDISNVPSVYYTSVGYAKSRGMIDLFSAENLTAQPGKHAQVGQCYSTSMLIDQVLIQSVVALRWSLSGP